MSGVVIHVVVSYVHVGVDEYHVGQEVVVVVAVVVVSGSESGLLIAVVPINTEKPREIENIDRTTIETHFTPGPLYMPYTFSL